MCGRGKRLWGRRRGATLASLASVLMHLPSSWVPSTRQSAQFALPSPLSATTHPAHRASPYVSIHTHPQGAPLGRDFCQFVEAAQVTALGLVPSIVKAWRAADAPAGLDWSAIHTFSSSGEASSPEDYHWLASRVARYRPVIEYCGGTEIAGGFLAGSVLQPQVASMFSTPALGARLVLLVGAEGRQSDHTSGEAVTG